MRATVNRNDSRTLRRASAKKQQRKKKVLMTVDRTKKEDFCGSLVGAIRQLVVSYYLRNTWEENPDWRKISAFAKAVSDGLARSLSEQGQIAGVKAWLRHRDSWEGVKRQRRRPKAENADFKMVQRAEYVRSKRPEQTKKVTP